MPGTARILAIDGGGIRGIIPAAVLRHIEQRTGSPIADLFHMVAGTSTGGILGAGLTAPDANGRPRFSAADMGDLYRTEGEEIFSHSFWHGFGSLGGTADEKYEADNLERILRERLGDTPLSAALGDLLVTSYDIRRRRPLFFKSWRARGEDLEPGQTPADREFRLRDAARATSAAPTYVDGGVFANNPAMCAVASARILYPGAANFLIVSLGTGLTEREIPYEQAKDWGLLGWARPLLGVIFDGVSDTVHYQLAQEFNQGARRRYYRFQIDLGGRRDDPASPNDDMDDARPENIRLLEAKAEELIRRERPNPNRLINQLKRPRDPRVDLVA
jgi:predicted acylesterase/phospholipase RssA